MHVEPGAPVGCSFTTHNPTTKALANADALPVGTVLRNGIADAVVVTITNTGSGNYRAAFTVPEEYDPGDQVELYAAATVAGVAGGGIVWRAVVDSLVAEVAVATPVGGTPLSYSLDGSLYCARADIEDLFGTTNVARWADLENQGNAAHITTRIDRARVVATARINDRLRGGKYVLPITSAGAAATLVNLGAALAGDWLYSTRAVDDEEEGIGKAVKRIADRAEKTLDEIRSDRIQLDAEIHGLGTTAPFVVR